MTCLHWIHDADIRNIFPMYFINIFYSEIQCSSLNNLPGSSCSSSSTAYNTNITFYCDEGALLKTGWKQFTTTCSDAAQWIVAERYMSTEEAVWEILQEGCTSEYIYSS